MNLISHAIAAVKEVVDGLGQGIHPNGVIEISEGTYQVFTPELWLRAGDVLTFSETTLSITEIGCGWVKGAADALPTGTFNTPTVYFMHGTVMAVGNELNQISNAELFTPLIYYVEVTSSSLDFDTGKQVDSINNARLLFLKSCNINDWLTQAHYTNVIEVMEQLFTAFVEGCRNSAKIAELTTGRVSAHIQVGTYDKDGAKNNLFVFPMSGLDVKMDIPLYSQNCNCN